MLSLRVEVGMADTVGDSTGFLYIYLGFVFIPALQGK